MADNNWAPKIPDAPPYRTFQPTGNKLQGHPDPVISQIGDFLAAEPQDETSVGMRAFGGMMLGLSLAQLDPSCVDRIFAALGEIAPFPGGDVPFRNAAARILQGQPPYSDED